MVLTRNKNRRKNKGHLKRPDFISSILSARFRRGTSGRKDTRRNSHKNKKPSNSSKRNRKAWAALPQSSFRRRVSLSFSSWAGFLAFGSSQNPLPSHPEPKGQWLLIEGSTRRLQWRDRGRFTRPFLLSPLARGTTGTTHFQRTTNGTESSIGGRQASTGIRGTRLCCGSRIILTGLCIAVFRIDSAAPDALLHKGLQVNARAKSVRVRSATFRHCERIRGCHGRGWRAGAVPRPVRPSR
jgi:hypothetical protein